MTQHWPDELWARGTRPPVPSTPGEVSDPQNGAESVSGSCLRCGSAEHPHMCLRDQPKEPVIPFDWARVACPVCRQPADHRCRTRVSGRVTDAHMPRVQLAYARNPQIRHERLKAMVLNAIFGDRDD